MRNSTTGSCRWLAIVLSGLLMLAEVALAGDLGPVFRTLGVVDGLPDSRVEAIVQDRHGYIWIGTQSGLVRHAGHQLTRLSHDPAEPNALPGVNIMSLLAASDGSVWAAIAGQGVVQIGPDLGLLQHLAPSTQGGVLAHDNIWAMTEDCAGGIWLAFMRGGVVRLDPDSGELQHFDQHADFGLNESGFQMEMMTDARCRVWLVQSDQVSRLDDLAQSAFHPVLVRDRAANEPIFNAITQAADGTIYLTQLRSLKAIDEHGRVTMQLDAEATITGFAHQDDGWLLLSTYDGLLPWHPEHGPGERIRAVDGVEDGLPSSALYDLMLDAEGGLWFSVFRNGLAYLPPGHQAFARYQAVPGREDGLQLRAVAAMAPAREPGVLWLGSRDGGVQRLDLNTGQAEWIQDVFGDETLAELGPVTSLARLGRRLVLGWSREIRLYDPVAGALEPVLVREQVDQGTFSFIVADGSDAFWAATFDAGLFRVDLASGEREHFHADGAGHHYWPEEIVAALVAGPDGWWLAGREVIYRWRADGGFEPAFTVDDGPIQAMLWTADGLWVATDFSLSLWLPSDQGMVRSDRHRLAALQPGGRIHALYPGLDRELWLVLANGVARFQPEFGQIRSYARPDGLAVAEFPRFATLGLDSGRIAIGSTRGLVLVDPARAGVSSQPPPVLVTGVQAGDRYRVLTPGTRDPLVLEHHTNTLAIDFAALSYIAPSQTRYRLRLAGWDETWLELSGQTRHFYSSLRPGRYRFEVQAAIPGGHWGDNGDSLELLIQAPPWRRGPALVAYALVALAVTGAGWRGLLGLRRRRREMREARQKRALAEEQRQVVERLNANLAPEPLAVAIGTELMKISGARRGWFLYHHEQLPDEPIPLGDSAAPMDAETWQARAADSGKDTWIVVELDAAEQSVAACLLEAGPAGFDPDRHERVGLLRQMAAQALHNLLLIEKVRALAERAEQASAAKSEFLATMSHEIRTPLHGVMGMVELLDDAEASPNQQSLLRTLRQSGLQLQRIIDDVLDISRIEAGRLSLEIQPFELVSLLEQVIDLHAPNAARKQLDLRLRLASDLPLLAHGDADRLAQVLGNLLSNAVKFTAQGGIEVSVGHRGAWLEIAVSDSGPGIDPVDRRRLFEPFVQLDASITRAHSGSGLGLAICRRLVGAMGGELGLAEQPVSGSRFEIRLPILQAGPLNRPLSALLSKIVVAAWVDASTRRVLWRLGRRWGFRVLDARRHEPVAADVFLVHAEDTNSSEIAEAWRELAGGSVRLDIPYRKTRVTSPDRAETLLRWPLVESRIVGLLMDRALSLKDH
ncbi:MAG: hybrid sensor histidine kinase/response regulator [Wenzhouxiangella sp.]|nr:MAG: hybrid sensor histidine kinase/response regulator [Wenzhouxiangella sp.]